MGDTFTVKVEDLTNGSSVRVRVLCDYCKTEYDIAWYSYVSLRKKENNKDCCSCPECTAAKAKESLIRKYNVDNARSIPGVNEKIKKTCIERYGTENPFQSEIIKDKIRDVCLKKYGVAYPTQSSEVQAKTIRTNMEKYGHKSWMQVPENAKCFSGENSPVWKGGVSRTRYERAHKEYYDWRTSVFERDGYTCQRCGAHNQKGTHVELHAHHLKNWADNPDSRYIIENGVTLCSSCHYAFHSMFGKKNNTPEQFNEFIKDEKIC